MASVLQYTQEFEMHLKQEALHYRDLILESGISFQGAEDLTKQVHLLWDAGHKV